MLLAEDNIKSVAHGQDLPRHCGNGRSGDAHGGHPKQAKNKDRIQYDVGARTNEHKKHGVDHIPRCLEDFFQIDLYKSTYGKDGNHWGISAGHLHQHSVAAEHLEKGAGQQSAQQRKYRPAANAQEDTVGGRRTGLIPMTFSQPPGDQAVEPHSGAHRHRDHQRLHRKSQGNCRQRVDGVVLSHKNAVHHVIQRLHQHGKHSRHRHGKDQRDHGGRPHFICFILFQPVHSFCPKDYFAAWPQDSFIVTHPTQGCYPQCAQKSPVFIPGILWGIGW